MNRVENRDLILDDYLSILDECVSVLDVWVSVLARLTKPERAFVWVSTNQLLTLDTGILERPLWKFEHYTPALLLRESPFVKVLAIVW